jgi:hypothetical protein
MRREASNKCLNYLIETVNETTHRNIEKQKRGRRGGRRKSKETKTEAL